ncbi:MAG: gfo/Idh/MocA family oxidoreductase, partial [Verrucomicrobia bacterium]
MTENKITRRSFVERSLATGAVLALPTHRVLGANSDIRVAIIGCGGKGTSHLRDFATKPGVRIVAISDADKAHMNSAENQLKNTLDKQGANVDARYRQHQDFRHILDRPDVDVVVIATPNHWHALLTVMACQAGKDVYVEKPVSHCIWEGRKSIEAARKYNRIVQAGTQQRS